MRPLKLTNLVCCFILLSYELTRLRWSSLSNAFRGAGLAVHCLPSLGTVFLTYLIMKDRVIPMGSYTQRSLELVPDIARTMSG
jgi:hypothetical protein